MIRIPTDFRAVVTTPPARVDNSTLPLIQAYVKQLKLADFDGHRIVHMHQVEQIDSSAVAGLLDIIKAAERHGRQFLMCDPPPIVRSYLELYGADEKVAGRVLSSFNDGTYETELLGFVPPFVPNPAGRMDVYTDGKVKSYEFGGKSLKDIPPVDLAAHPPKAPTRANRMEVRDGDTRRELKSLGFVHVRKHNCGCDATHSTFERLHALHAWFRGKGFDFKDLEIWASDIPSGMVTEKMTFRDRLHWEQFQTLLKIDSGWKKIGAPMEHLEEEYYYAY
jgi:anti-anti-sigma regulatory factor